MEFRHCVIEIKKEADPAALSFEAYYYMPTLKFSTYGVRPNVVKTKIRTRSLKSAIFRSITLANELAESIDPNIIVCDEYLVKTIAEYDLTESVGNYFINFEADNKTTNTFKLGKRKIIKKENINE